MKRKFLSIVILFIVFTFFSTGCSSKENQSNASKNLNSTWDYSSGIQSYLVDWNDKVLMQPNGFYFVDPQYSMLYFYDYKAKKSVPVCNKPDCEHRSGLNEYGGIVDIIGDPAAQAEWGTKPTDCNAFIQGSGNLTIYKGRIYFDSEDYSNIQVLKHSICSMKMDGTDRRIELENYLNVTLDSNITTIHFSGDKLFYSNFLDKNHDEFNMIDLGTKKVTQLYQYNICEQYPDYQNQYQGNVYYIRWKSVDFEDPHYSGTLYKYSPTSKKTTAIYSGPISGYTFVKNQIYFSNEKSICKMSLDGKNVTPIFDAPGNLEVRYDGNYLYVDDGEFAASNAKKGPILVTKLDGTKVDSIERINGVPLFGDQNVFLSTYSYLTEKEVPTQNIVMLNKSDIGKKHHFYRLITGEEISITKLAKKVELSQ